MDTLRHAHHAEVFRTLVRDVERELTVEQVADDLSALADAVLDITLRWSWALLKSRHREQPCIAVIAYGKLGSKELGYGSDLDVVFLYDDADEDDKDRAQEVYGAYVRKLITWLTLRTAAGELFEIDTALRPNGNSGLLVTSIDAFERYQSGRGSNTAWTWEHQAITRARLCAGATALAPRFEATRRALLGAQRDVHAAARRDPRDARQGARRAPGASRPLRRQAQPRRHDGRRVRGAVPGADAVGAACRAARQRRQHRVAAARRSGRAAARRASARPPRMPTANCAAPSTWRAWTNSRRRSSRRRWPRRALRCWRCGARCLTDAAARAASRWSRPAAAWLLLSAVLGVAAVAAFGVDRDVLDWQPDAARVQAWRWWSAAFVHFSTLHLLANLLATALVAAYGWAARVPREVALAWLAGLAADAPAAVGQARTAALRRAVRRAACGRGRRHRLSGDARARCAPCHRLDDAGRPGREAAGRTTVGRGAAPADRAGRGGGAAGACRRHAGRRAVHAARADPDAKAGGGHRLDAPNSMERQR